MIIVRTFRVIMIRLITPIIDLICFFLMAMISRRAAGKNLHAVSQGMW